MPRERRLLVLASKPPGMSPSQRYRFEQWAPHLAREHAISLDFAAFECRRLAELLYEPGHIVTKAALTLKDYARRSSVLTRVAEYDAVVIHREAALIGPAIYERLLAKRGTPIIYDFDDAIWSLGKASKNGLFSRLHFPGKTSTICRLASAVTVGNPYLADYARQWNPSVEIVPSSIELADYPVMPESADQKFVVCWTGSTTTLIHFEHARPALEKLARLLPLTVKIICSEPPLQPIAGAEMLFVPWRADREAVDVGDCHVGIMPLPDNDFSRGKGAMKALQYMATGRPVVVSPVGVNSKIVRPGDNGFLASTTAEWVDCLSALARDRQLRERLGKCARATVERDYSAAASAAKFARVVNRSLEPTRLQ